MKEKMLHLGKNIIAYSSMLLIGVLFIISVFSTAYFDPENLGAEHPLYRFDNPLWFICFAVVLMSIFYFIKKIPVKILFAVLMVYTLGAGVYWVSAGGVCPDADQMSVSLIASLTAQNNFLFFEPEKYMQIYPNQLGMVAFLEMIYRIAGGENYQIFQYINAVANCFVIAALYAIVDILFKKETIKRIFLILSFGCIHLILYSTFVYGVTMGLAFALWSVFLALYFIERKNRVAAIGSCICMALAILFKNNYSIFLVALVLLFLYKGIEKKRLEFILWIILLLGTWKGTEGALISLYEQRSGIELTAGMPKVMWVAMGMQEGERAEGWYNAFNYDTFRETGCDAEKSSEIAKSAIKKSAIAFWEHPGYAAEFYYKKFVSQWNEPTYASIWVNMFHQGEFSVLIQSFYDGKINTVAVEYMNLYQSFLFMGAVILLICNRKKWKEEQLILFLIILGGFFFHMLWEAKSQYIMPYFILLLPYAAAGADLLYDNAKLYINRKRK